MSDVALCSLSWSSSAPQLTKAALSKHIMKHQTIIMGYSLIQVFIPHSAFLQQLVRIMHLVGELCVWSSQNGSCALRRRSHQPPSSVDFCLAAPLWCEPGISTFRSTQTLSLQRAIKSVLMLPACHLMPQWGRLHAQTHKHHFQEGLCKKKKKKERKYSVRK